MSQPHAKKTGKTIAPPKGTRDAYPEDVLRRRYVTQAWRDAAIRCGFDEIEGPTFEAAELYAVKSGDGILSELFQAFSGKSPDEVEQVQREGKAPYALRPEFTPTLARMYAAKAKELPQPCKWFTAGPYFRAEKPQRGRLREFLQWNVDAIGAPEGSENPKAEMDTEVIECAICFFDAAGISDTDVKVNLNDRAAAARVWGQLGVQESQHDKLSALIDALPKRGRDWFAEECRRELIPESVAHFYSGKELQFQAGDSERITSMLAAIQSLNNTWQSSISVMPLLARLQLASWTLMSPHIVRGLAYYTGTVFEVIADGERAVAGGGRYDNLIELFGGPPTPACGFGMGDVVLSNLLDDKGLFPEGLELMEAVSRPTASVRPEAFVIHNGSDEARAQVRPLVAALRRGVEAAGFDGKPWSAARYDAGAQGVRPVHARQSYKATGNPGKLFADAKKQFARFVVEIGQGSVCTLKSLDRNETITPPAGDEWSTDPSEATYVGHALVRELH